MKKFSGRYVIIGDKISTKPPMKGGHRHNHARNVLERKLNKSKDSRKRCHNHLNKGFNYKLIVGRCLRRVK